MSNPAFALKGFVCGAAAAIPIALGYAPIAMAFGVISIQSGIMLFEAFSMSLMVFAGASQFMAIGMITMGVSWTEIVLATFVLNLRHFIMSMSVMNKLRIIPRAWKPVLSFGITDETFAVIALKGEEGTSEQNHFYAAGVISVSYVSWVSGTLAGGLLAGIIPPTVGSSMSIGLYAMFIGLLVPAVKGSWRLGLIAFTSILLSSVLGLFMNRGWAIVAATVIGAAVGVFLVPEEEDT